MKYQIFKSSDTNVSKFVFEYEDPKAIAEAVLYRYGSYQNRTVICCSVQSGCRVGCAFCGTGRFFVRNLTAEEIVSQVETALSTIDLKPVCITEKWLNKLGFTIKERWPSQSGDYFFRPDRKVKIGISTRYGNTISLNNEDDPDIYMISYVHELQNLYKDMTGETI